MKGYIPDNAIVMRHAAVSPPLSPLSVSLRAPRRDSRYFICAAAGCHPAVASVLPSRSRIAVSKLSMQPRSSLHPLASGCHSL